MFLFFNTLCVALSSKCVGSKEVLGQLPQLVNVRCIRNSIGPRHVPQWACHEVTCRWIEADVTLGED